MARTPEEIRKKREKDREKWRSRRSERRSVRDAAGEAEQITELPHLITDEPDEPDEDELPREPEPDRQAARRAKNAPQPKANRALYRVVVVLAAAIFALIVVENLDNLTPANIINWVRTKVVGIGLGDGYPTSLVGSTADPANFGAEDGSLYVLSDTALTVYNSSAKQLFSTRHSYSEPTVSAANNRYLLYNMGSTGYRVETAAGTEISGVAESDITAAAICSSGKFAMAVQPTDYASRVLVYKPNGTLQYRYNFADTHITAIALNHDGTKGAVAAITSRSGELVTQITMLDFSKEQPVAQYESRGNFIFSMLWSRDDTVIAVGDTETLVGDIDGFSAYGYGGRTITAYCMTESRAIVSVSKYEYGGVSTLLIFKDSPVPVEAELPGRAVWLSGVGAKAGALISGQVVSVDLVTGELEAGCEAASDTKSIAMADEGTVYMLGVREVRKANLTVGGVSEEDEEDSKPESHKHNEPRPDSVPTPEPEPTPTPEPETELDADGGSGSDGGAEPLDEGTGMG